MDDLLIAYWEFWSKAVSYKNGYLPVFPRDGVPDGQPFPFLTYDITDRAMFDKGLDDVFIWTRSGDLRQLSGFVGQIKKAIPHSGTILTLPNNAGATTLYRGSPFFQLYPQEDKAIKAGRILLQINSLSGG